MTQRKSLDGEAQALSKEYFRISQSTEFNGLNILSGELDSINLQGGIGSNAVLSSGVGGAIGTGSFDARIASATGAGPQDIATGDFNGDGIFDLATADYAGDTVSILRGLGNGTFSTAVTYAVGDGPSSIAGGDFNADGLYDVAITSRISNSMSVLHGMGNGTLSAAVSYSTGSTPDGVASGDFNGDGVWDLVSADANAGVSMFLGRSKDGVAPLLPFSLRTMADARQALPVFKQKREQLAAQRGEIGAFQSRIGVAVNVLHASSENFKAAESRIRDTDVAAESANLVRHEILQQTASSILAQANQQPQIAIQLLGRI